MALAKATEELRSRLGRVPTTRELAALMSLSEEVIEARKASNGYTSASLDAAITSSEDGEAALADFIGVDDNALGLDEDFNALAPLIAGLDDRERCIIHMRFVDELTQAQIGEHLGGMPGPVRVHRPPADHRRMTTRAMSSRAPRLTPRSASSASARPSGSLSAWRVSTSVRRCRLSSMSSPRRSMRPSV